ncbi:cytochrome c3 family protein [Planctomyces sp. SH-PL14]|uniref:cytochrome c3 family protein n=1 Tax=Planctomyces sp. SH-PL14 TaxID=1632864 RepID=UPI00078EC328|nr:cytochrome c3 family protein [Planctomyces sp. SH-PL14]AMV21205.1 Doubled CXXCH motif protein [Planctomyces sp. SH-PL14]
MPDQRRLKDIASRYDVEVARQVNRTRVWRRRLVWLSGVLTLFLLIPVLGGDHRAFQARPISDGHRVFEKNCKACHDQSFATFRRLLHFDNRIHSTSDAQCQTCHAETSENHIHQQFTVNGRFPDKLLLGDFLTGTAITDLEKQFDEIGCAGCHVEHNGGSLLAAITDEHCTRCHAKLAPTLPDPKFQLTMGSFHDHPEFAILRDPPPDTSVPGRHRALQLTRLEEGQLVDNVALEFNHHLHLEPNLIAGKDKTRTLACVDCHERDVSGAYLRPINFERHCQECHKLGFKATGELPHEAPEIIRGILVDRLSATAAQQTQPPQDPLGGPTKAPSKPTKAGDFSALYEEWEQRLFSSSQKSVEPGRPELKSLLESACTKCHKTEKSEEGSRVSWKVVPPRIPERWMPHSRFRHDRHESMSCEACHTRNGLPYKDIDTKTLYPTLPANANELATVFASTTSRDILMPAIEVCQKCHGQRAVNTGTVAVGAGCIECHLFHHGARDKVTKTGIREFLEGRSPAGRPEDRQPAIPSEALQ